MNTDLLFLFSMLACVGVHFYAIASSGSSIFKNPLKIFYLISFIKVIPYMLLSYFDNSLIDYRIHSYIGTEKINIIITQFAIQYALMMLTTAAIFFSLQHINSKNANSVQRATLRSVSGFVGFRRFGTAYLIAISTASAAGKVYALGSLTGTIFGDDLGNRAQVSSGLGYLIGISDTLISLTSLLLLINHSKKKTLFSLAAFVISLIVAVMSLSLFGGRKSVIILVIIYLVFWSHYYKNVKLTSFRIVLILGLLSVYFLGMLTLRLGDNYDDYFYKEGYGRLNSLVTLSANLSYNNTYYFITEYSNREDGLNGLTLRPILYSALPSRIFQDKPPTDEGVYMKAVIEGNKISWTEPSNNFNTGSNPIESYGTALLNFGVIGILVIGATAGAILHLLMKLYKRSIGSPYAIYFVFLTALNMQISSLRLVNTLSSVLFLAISFCIIYPALSRRRGHY